MKHLNKCLIVATIFASSLLLHADDAPADNSSEPVKTETAETTETKPEPAKAEAVKPEPKKTAAKKPAAAPELAVQNETDRDLRFNFRGVPLETVLNYLSDAAGFVIIPEAEL